ncbi:MAG: hypothetical protein MI919_34385 [Holophagales bacterium]|nr:hypothetical protein [Holophagales bacterium]
MPILPTRSRRPPSRVPRAVAAPVFGRASLGRRLALLFTPFLCLLLTGCPETWDRQQKSSLSAIWVSSESQTLSTSEVARLKDSGVEEAFLTVARFDGSADPPLERLEIPDLESGLPATLVVEGAWSAGEPEADRLAGQISESVRQLRFDVESLGVLVVGIHFDLRPVRDFATYGRFLSRVNDGLEEGIFLSATMERKWLGSEELGRVADAVDFVVPFLYGQRLGEAEDGDAWDFASLERYLQQVEQLGVPYQIGAVILGTASHISRSGTSQTTRQDLPSILWNRSLALKPGFTLEGVDRRVYSVVAEEDTRVGGFKVRANDQIRVVRAATSDLEELLRRVDLWDIPNHLGQVYFRVPSEDEGLSLHIESLLNALSDEPASPELGFTVSVQRRTGRGYLVRFGLENKNREFTELALLENNYLQVTLEQGELTTKVDPGDFYRFELYRRDGDSFERTFRDPNMLRVHVPILEGQQRVSTGDVEVVVRGEPRFLLEARFLLPDGRTLELGPRIWSKGKLE